MSMVLDEELLTGFRMEDEDEGKVDDEDDEELDDDFGEEEVEEDAI